MANSVLPIGTDIASVPRLLGRSHVVRQRFLVPPFAGSIPAAPASQSNPAFALAFRLDHSDGEPPSTLASFARSSRLTPGVHGCQAAAGQKSGGRQIQL